MSILGAALAGSAQGAQSYFDNHNLELREQAERAFQMRLLDRAEAREDLRHERAVEQDYINYQRDTLNNDIAMARDDARYKDTRDDAERAFKQQDRQLDIMDRRLATAGQYSGGNSQMAKFYQDYNKEVAEVEKMKADGKLDDATYNDMIISIEQRYRPVLPGLFPEPGTGGLIDPYAQNQPVQAGNEASAQNQEEVDQIKQSAKDDLSEQGFDLKPSLGEQVGGLLKPVKETFGKFREGTNESFARKEYEKLTGAVRSGDSQGIQAQQAWNVVRFGEDVYPPGSPERELALKVLRAMGQPGVPNE